MNHVELSIEQARRLAIASQGLGASRFGRGRVGAGNAIRRLGYLQIDTISVVERAHHHTLWNRVPGYRRGHLDRLVAEREVLEYWAHAAAFLPMEDYRFCLPRMGETLARGRHWHPHDERVAREIVAVIRAEGPKRANDFEHHTGSTGMWEWGPVKRAIEYLFMAGILLVTRRENFQKVFDLAERVLPAGIDTTAPSAADFADYLVEGFITANGIAGRADFGHLRRNMKEALRDAVDRRIESGRLLPAQVAGIDGEMLVAADFESALSARLSRGSACLLSPFDNLVIQRRRVHRLFGFDYTLECYLPAARRRFGYFCLPVLWRGGLVARIDAKADRGSGTFQVLKVFCENEADDPAFDAALAAAIARLAVFAGCSRFHVGTTRPHRLRAALRAHLADHLEGR